MGTEQLAQLGQIVQHTAHRFVGTVPLTGQVQYFRRAGDSASTEWEETEIRQYAQPLQLLAIAQKSSKWFTLEGHLVALVPNFGHGHVRQMWAMLAERHHHCIVNLDGDVWQLMAAADQRDHGSGVHIITVEQTNIHQLGAACSDRTNTCAGQCVVECQIYGAQLAPPGCHLAGQPTPGCGAPVAVGNYC